MKLNQGKERLMSLLEEGTMVVQQLRRGRVNSSERLKYLLGEMRQENSMWPVLERICCTWWGGWNTGRLTMEGQSTEHREEQEVMVWESLAHRYQRPAS